MAHFEELWEEAEKLLESETMVSSWEQLVKEMRMKLSIVEQIENSALPKEEQDKIKNHVMGKLLLVLTQMSAKSGINVFAALKSAVDDRKISIFAEKYK